MYNMIVSGYTYTYNHYFGDFQSNQLHRAKTGDPCQYIDMNHNISILSDLPVDTLEHFNTITRRYLYEGALCLS
jgi:hypothetical protein